MTVLGTLCALLLQPQQLPAVGIPCRSPGRCGHCPQAQVMPRSARPSSKSARCNPRSARPSPRSARCKPGVANPAPGVPDPTLGVPDATQECQIQPQECQMQPQGCQMQSQECQPQPQAAPAPVRLTRLPGPDRKAQSSGSAFPPSLWKQKSSDSEPSLGCPCSPCLLSKAASGSLCVSQGRAGGEHPKMTGTCLQ